MAPSGKNFMALQHLRRGFTSTAGLLASIGAVGVPFLAPLYCFRAALTPALSRSVSGAVGSIVCEAEEKRARGSFCAPLHRVKVMAWEKEAKGAEGN